MTLIFDIEKALASGVFISGVQGSGKTHLCFHLADRLIKAGAIVFIFDPSQEWRHSRIPNKIITEADKEVTFNLNQSLVFDISRLHLSEQRNFTEKICRGLFDHAVHQPENLRRWTLLIFEEAQLYLHQGSMRAKYYEEAMRIVTSGRNFKLRYALVTQFPSTIDKLLIKGTSQRYFGNTSEKNDKAYIESFIGKEVEMLKDLQVGQFVYNCGSQVEKLRVPRFGDPEPELNPCYIA